MDIVALFCDIDDFCKQFEPRWQRRRLAAHPQQRHRQATLALSEGMTIEIAFHHSGYRTFKDYYTRHVRQYLRWAFPRLVSYNRFVELMQQALVPLCAYLHTRRGTSRGVAFIDSTLLAVCRPPRASNHKVFADLATWGRSSMGWCYGFKLHLLVNDCGDLLACHLTAANVDDRTPVPALTAGVTGKLIGDRGYISQALFDTLFAQGLQLVTKIRKNMKNKLMPLWDKLLLRKRALIESLIDQLKNLCQIAHSRHRSVANFLVNLVAGLIAYTWLPTKPSLNLRPQDLAALDHLPW